MKICYGEKLMDSFLLYLQNFKKVKKDKQKQELCMEAIIKVQETINLLKKIDCDFNNFFNNNIKDLIFLKIKLKGFLKKDA